MRLLLPDLYAFQMKYGPIKIRVNGSRRPNSIIPKIVYLINFFINLYYFILPLNLSLSHKIPAAGAITIAPSIPNPINPSISEDSFVVVVS